MFAKQRVETDRTYRWVLKDERRRIIKSASRRNPKKLAHAVIKSKQALQAHEEWRSN